DVPGPRLVPGVHEVRAATLGATHPPLPRDWPRPCDWPRRGMSTGTILIAAEYVVTGGSPASLKLPGPPVVSNRLQRWRGAHLRRPLLGDCRPRTRGPAVVRRCG